MRYSGLQDLAVVGEGPCCMGGGHRNSSRRRRGVRCVNFIFPCGIQTYPSLFVWPARFNPESKIASIPATLSRSSPPATRKSSPSSKAPCPMRLRVCIGLSPYHAHILRYHEALPCLRLRVSQRMPMSKAIPSSPAGTR